MGHQYNVETIAINEWHTNALLIQWSTAGQSAKISGWGKTQTELRSTRLKLADVDFVPGIFVVKGHTVDNRMLVANKSHGSWSCEGDSGGKCF